MEEEEEGILLRKMHRKSRQRRQRLNAQTDNRIKSSVVDSARARPKGVNDKQGEGEWNNIYFIRWNRKTKKKTDNLLTQHTHTHNECRHSKV